MAVHIQGLFRLAVYQISLSESVEKMLAVGVSCEHDLAVGDHSLWIAPVGIVAHQVGVHDAFQPWCVGFCLQQIVFIKRCLPDGETDMFYSGEKRVHRHVGREGECCQVGLFGSVGEHSGGHNGVAVCVGHFRMVGEHQRVECSGACPFAVVEEARSFCRRGLVVACCVARCGRLCGCGVCCGQQHSCEKEAVM